MIQTYHRPATLDEALGLLGSDGTAVLAGGTSLVASNAASAVVDLQDLGLDGISLDGSRVAIGAMVRLRDVVESDLVPAFLRDLARREAPSTIRNAATIGGAVATGHAESELVAGLLVYEAAITVAAGDGSTTHSLADYLEGRPRGIIIEITAATDGTAAAARTARTPADRPIVMAAARRGDNGETLLAMTGVAETPVAVDPRSLGAIDPPPDFRGTTEYRKHLADTLGARVIAELGT